MLAGLPHPLCFFKLRDYSAQQTQFVQKGEMVLGAVSGQNVAECLTQSLPSHRAYCAGLLAYGSARVGLYLEAQLGGDGHGSQHSEGVIVEGLGRDHSDCTGFQVSPAAQRIEGRFRETFITPRVQRQSHGIQGEVAQGEVFLDGISSQGRYIHHMRHLLPSCSA